METMNTENYQTIVRNAILEIFPKYDTTNEGQIPINKLLPFTQQVFDVLKAPPMNNQQWMTYSKDVDLNFDNKLSKMELFFAIKTYFSKKIKIEKEFDYPDFDDIGKGPGYSNATTFDNRLKGVVDSTYQQHNQSQNNNLNQKGNGGGFGTVANKQVTGFINACFGKMGVDFKVTQDQTNQALDLLSKNLGAKKEQNNNTANTNTNTNNSNNTNYYPNNNQSNPNNNYHNYNQNNNNNQYSYNSNSNNQNQRSNQGTDKMDIFMTLKNFLGK